MLEARKFWTVELYRTDEDQTPRYNLGFRLHTFKQRIVGQNWANEDGYRVYKGLYIQYI